MRPLRFLHTSDVHLDTGFSGAGFPSRLGDRKREAIRGTFRGILDRARLEGVDLVLVAGDLFEHDRVTSDTIEFLKRQFAALAPIRAFIAPGNHDPFLRRSPYEAGSWPGNVHIFRDEAWTSVQLPDLEARVAGFGFNRTQLTERPFAGLPPQPGGAWNLVVAHASEAARVPAGKAVHGPFSIDEIARKNVHYCALGHYHQQRPVENPIDATAVWYCGIPEERGWDEEGRGGYLLGILEDGGLRVERCSSGEYPLRTLRLDCDGFSSREQIVEAILRERGGAFDGKTILRVELHGYLDSRLELSLSELEERLAGEALFLRWEDRTRPALDFDAIAKEKTLRGQFVRRMGERIAAADGAERELLERARTYGLQALTGHEVRPR